MRIERTAAIAMLAGALLVAPRARVHAQAAPPPAAQNTPAAAEPSAAVATTQPASSDKPPHPAGPAKPAKPRGDAPIDPWAEHRPLPKPEPAQPTARKPAQPTAPAPTPAQAAPVSPTKLPAAAAPPPANPPAAPAHPEDAAIVHQLELYMLLEMMKDYDLFYDDPEPAPAKYPAQLPEASAVWTTMAAGAESRP
jgi:hypothetical protein